MYKANVRAGSLATLRPTNYDIADGLQVMSSTFIFLLLSVD